MSNPAISELQLFMAQSLAADLLKSGVTLAEALDAFRSAFLEEALVLSDNHKSRAAQLAGVHRNTLYRQSAPERIHPYPANQYTKFRGGKFDAGSA